MDGENAALQKRLSSILKSGKPRNTDDDERTDEITNQRRVSFARKSSVKPFKSDAEGNATVWDATYEEAAIQSDQSTGHTTTDSAVHSSIEVSNICQTKPQQTKSLGKANILINKTCVGMDEDIEIEADDIQFAPVRQTIIHNAKFANLNTDDDKLIRNSFNNPSLDKENIQINIPGVLLENEENMQLENDISELIKASALKQSNYNPPMDIINIVEDTDQNDMNFTIQQVKKLKQKPSNPQISNKNIEIDDNMEFTAVISTKLLQENVFRTKVDCENALKVDLNSEFNENNDMEFTKSIPAVLLEKLKLKNETENKNRSILLDLIVDDAIKSNLQPNKMSTIENMDITMINKHENVKKCSLDREKDPEICGSFAEQQNIVLCVAKQRNSSCQFDPTSEIDDTQYLINYKSRISEEPVVSSGLIRNSDEKLSKLPEIKLVEIPKVVKIPENLLQVDESCKKQTNPIITHVIDDRNLIDLVMAMNNPTKIADLHKTELHTQNVLADRSEIDVFKPSSKNATRTSYFESMEIGTPYMTRNDEFGTPLRVNRCETDKIIFAAESVCAWEFEGVPEEAFGVARRSVCGVADGCVVTTHVATRAVEGEVVGEAGDGCVFEESRVDDQGNLSASKVELYSSNEGCEMGDGLNGNGESGDGSAGGQTVRTPEDPCSKKPPALSYLPNISPNLSVDQLYDLLGWSTIDIRRGVPLPMRITAKEKKRQLAARLEMRLLEEKGMERLAQGCHKMLETVAQIDRENAERSAENLARSQGRTLRPLSVEEWLQQQRKIQSTLWSLESLTNNSCVVSSRFAHFHLEMEADSFIITSTIVDNVAASKSANKLKQFISKLFVDKMQKSQIQNAIGTKYNLRTFLEYIQMKLDDVVKIEREFLNIFRKVLIEARLSFDDDLNLQYLLIGRSRWLIKINCFDINNLSQNSIVETITLSGDCAVAEKEIKKIARKCSKGLPFLCSFVDGVYEFRNMRERNHCRVLNVLLNKRDSKSGKL